MGGSGIIFLIPYLPRCPVSFGWMFGPVGRLRVLLPSEISTEIRRRRWSLVSSFPGHKGYALRKATATIRALLAFFTTCLSACLSFSPLPSSDPYLLALVLFLLAFISRGRGRFSLRVRVRGRYSVGQQTPVVGKYRGLESPWVPRRSTLSPHRLPPEWSSRSGGAGFYGSPPPPATTQAATATTTLQSASLPPSDEPHIGGEQRSRHRSENKQRKTAWNRAAFTGSRKHGHHKRTETM